MTHGPGFASGTHALRKRCPVCKIRRRFYSPSVPHSASKRWRKVDGRWVCLRCADKAPALP